MEGGGAVGEVEDRSDCACFEVFGAVDEGFDAGLEDGSGAHGAGFEGDVEGAVGESPVVEVLGSCSEGEEFGVAEGVLVAIAAVLGLGDRLALGVEEDCADGDVTGLSGLVGLGEGLVHPVVVVIHGAMGAAVGLF